MTSKEALEELESLCEIDIPTELYEPCIEAIKQDLEVLEILKKHNLIKNEAVYLDKEDWNKVKEWLEK